MESRTLSIARGSSLALAGCVLTFLAMPSARAEPFGGTIQRATVDLRAKGTDSSIYQISLAAERSRGPYGDVSVLSVSLTQCELDVCGDPVNYVKDLDEDSFSVATDGSGATVNTIFAGRPLSIKWSEAGTTVFLDANPDSATIGRGGSASASVGIMGFGCEGVAGSTIYGVTVVPEKRSSSGDASEPSRPPKGLRPTKTKAPRCAL